MAVNHLVAGSNPASGAISFINSDIRDIPSFNKPNPQQNYDRKSQNFDTSFKKLTKRLSEFRFYKNQLFYKDDLSIDFTAQNFKSSMKILLRHF